MSDFSRKRPMKSSVKMTMLALLVLVGGLPGISPVYAGSCAYGEAMMALENGNTVRGLALMRMASRDGDRRAENYLREQGGMTEFPALAKVQQPLSLPRRTARY